MRSGEHLPGGVEALPFGLLAAFAEEKEIQITELAECGFRFRVAEAIAVPSYFKVCFYERELEGKTNPCYREICLKRFEMERIEEKIEETIEIAGVCEETGHEGRKIESKVPEKKDKEKAEEKAAGIEAYWVEYLVKAEQTDYQQAVRRQIGSYGRYIRLKLEGDDAALAEALVGYPAELDEEYCTSWEEQKRAWRKEWESQRDGFKGKIDTVIAESWKKELQEKAVVCEKVGQEKRFEYKPNSRGAVNEKIEIAVELERPELYQEFLEQEPQAFFRCYCQENGLTRHWLSSQRLKRIYIGNAFCPLLSPEEECLFELMEKAYKNGLGITLTTSWIRDERLAEVERLLDKVENWCQTWKQAIEIQVNDWALVDMLRERRMWLKPSLGILLHKRRKDPRMRYLKGKMIPNWEDSSERQSFCKEEQSGKTEMQSGGAKINIGGSGCLDGEYADFYQEYLRGTLGIERLEEEALPNLLMNHIAIIQRDGMKHSLHLPYYQTNTSSYCPLYAQIVRGARGRQALVRDCPQFCSQYTFLYPNHLKMVGRYNSLFGMDDRILRARDALDEYVAAGVDRIVLNFL